MPRWTKITLLSLSAILSLILIAFIALAVYVNLHKKELLVSITKELNKNLEGNMTIGGMDPTLLKSFPDVSLLLMNVELRDKEWQRHHQTLLKAKRFNISINALAMLRGAIAIKKIGIEDASINLFTDTNGYSNAAVFKKKPGSTKSSESNLSTELKRFSFKKVNFKVDNQKGNKLFDFAVNDLTGRIDYLAAGWHARFKLNTRVRSFAFKTDKGSFIKDKLLEGPFSVEYNDKMDQIVVKTSRLKIGEGNFRVGGKFNLASDPVTFTLNIKADQIHWKAASSLLSPKVRSTLDKFNFDKPLDVNCDIAGNLGGGNPSIRVSTDVKNNTLTTPGGKITNCSFNGSYTNNQYKGRGFNDANSAVMLYQFKGNFEGIPLEIDTAAINNLKRPVATGVVKSNFKIERLNEVIGDDLLRFEKGTARVNLRYRADMVNLQLSKPYLQGTVAIDDASINYVPRNLQFRNTSISLVFTEKDLLIKNLQLQSGKSVVMMDGTIKNFLNLYYNAPEKIVLSWDVRSPQIHLGEFLGFLGSRKVVATKRKKTNSFSNNLSTAFDKSNVDLTLNLDKVYYNKFLATGAHANIYLSQNGIDLKNVRVNHAGGSLNMNGRLTQKGKNNLFTLKANLSKVDIKAFFRAFNNFGLATLTSNNLKGYLYAKTTLKGLITDQGALQRNSIYGNVIFDLKKGELNDFEPILNVAKFAFPLRNLNNITIRNLNGKFDLNGERITINPMQINSSVLNMDVAGIYSYANGTNIALDIPLRNPKKDNEIEDPAERKERRMRGLVLRILAVDGEDGKIKLKWNKDKK
ncbi:AsmA family protein [Pedobacter sp.]|uniref:AsmA family protein n=1 Tax=Pedobacter sp. TaxID=1411316 RepID=UPI003D7F8DEA